LDILKKFNDNFKDHNASYKMVTVLSMLDTCDKNGRAYFDEVLERFQNFYFQRYQKGKIIERDNKVLANVANIDKKTVKNTFLQGPVAHLGELLNLDKDNQVLSFCQELTEELAYKTKNELRKIAFKHLYEYYRNIGGLGLTTEDFRDLPLEYPVKADDIASFSGHNRVKGIHPIDKDDFKAVIILCTLGGSNYPNQWIDEENGILKYYAEGRKGPDGVKNYNLEMRSNKAIIESKEKGFPLYVFTRDAKGELYHFAGEFEYQTLEEEQGEVYFVLKRKEVNQDRVSLPDVSYEQNQEELDIVGDEDVKTVIEDVEKYIEGKGFEFEEGLIKNLFLSLKTKPFVILAGISGTGKSQLGELFANALGANRENRRYRLVSVRPDWNDSTDLLGYLNLQNEFVKGPLTEILEVALENPCYPYYVCLDEMNLARVEYYFSEFLSIIESRRWAENTIISAPIDNKGYSNNSELFFPPNLYVIGTVNMDETTHSFSRKVLDRANTIELSQVDLSKMPSLQKNLEPPYNMENSFLQSSYLTLKDCLPEYQSYLQGIIPELESVNGFLENLGLHVGYRVRDEFCFFMLYNQKFELMKEKKCIDLQILQKILPRIHGSSIEVEEVLGELKSYCEEQGYELSNSKLNFMLRRYNQDGFTSFWA